MIPNWLSPGWAPENSRWFAALGTPPELGSTVVRARMGAGTGVVSQKPKLPRKAGSNQLPAPIRARTLDGGSVRWPHVQSDTCHRLLSGAHPGENQFSAIEWPNFIPLLWGLVLSNTTLG
ncbi:MAG: hypothetical protein HY774_18795 [Acidobacteria bacterium]|nr:hypothetical protein [Acidobacteriota bacterium]